MNIKKILIGAAASALMLGSMAASTFAAGPHGPVATAPGQNKLQCFDGTSDGGFYGLCTLPTKGAKGSAILDNISNDATGTTNPNDQYSGVYTATSNMYGKTIGNIGQLSFNYSGTSVDGALRFSIPISTDGNSTFDVWAFVGADNCNNGAGLVDVVNDSTCLVSIGDGTESYPNWAAFVAAHPTWSIATNAYVFVIADQPGKWTISNVNFGKPGK